MLLSLAAMLQFMLEDSGVMTECELSTVDATDELDFPSAFRYVILHRMLCVSTTSFGCYYHPNLRIHVSLNHYTLSFT